MITETSDSQICMTRDMEPKALHIMVAPAELTDKLCCVHLLLISGGEFDFVKVWMCY